MSQIIAGMQITFPGAINKLFYEVLKEILMWKRVMHCTVDGRVGMPGHDSDGTCQPNNGSVNFSSEVLAPWTLVKLASRAPQPSSRHG